jgi:rubrerythrin
MADQWKELQKIAADVRTAAGRSRPGELRPELVQNLAIALEQAAKDIQAANKAFTDQMKKLSDRVAALEKDH